MLCLAVALSLPVLAREAHVGSELDLTRMLSSVEVLSDSFRARAEERGCGKAAILLSV